MHNIQLIFLIQPPLLYMPTQPRDQDKGESGHNGGSSDVADLYLGP